MSDTSTINDLSAFQQTPSARVRDPGPATNANPPPPPPDPSKKLQQEPSPHPMRGQYLNFTI
ncbi:MAG: hypothetical protein AB7H70_08045 [Rhodospirillaceae bacterium]|nr:hypothetical protein [Rhodospirillaceae bacterium]